MPNYRLKSFLKGENRIRTSVDQSLQKIQKSQICTMYIRILCQVCVCSVKSGRVCEYLTTFGSYQMKSPQCEQNVGCLRNVAMNLWELTWCTLRFIAPRRCLSLNPFSCSLNWRMGWDCSSCVAHCNSILTCSWPCGSRSTCKRRDTKL